MSKDLHKQPYAAKNAYQDIEQASSYDAQRFTSFRGKVGDALDKRTLSRALMAIPRSKQTPLRILDIPCGTGRITRYLLEQGEFVTGADISAEMMQVAEKKVSSFERFGGFFQEDASALTFEDNSFDAVVSIRFIGHIPRDVRINILKEFGRVSRYAIVEYGLKSKTVELRRALDSFLKTGSQLPKRWGWHTFEKKELVGELNEAGMEVLNMWQKLPFLSDSHYVLLKRKDYAE